MCEMEGYRYYKDAQTGKQYCLDSAGTWYTYDEENGVFTPHTVTQQNVKKTKHEDNIYLKLKNMERFGIKFDNNGRPIYPKNEKGLFILPTDEKGLPFFPVDDRSKPIFPYDYEKDELTFPVDETDEPIFPRNEQNKPIVPNDKNGQPIFPIDKNGSFIFPLDENNCPVPALNLDGTPVVPKDTYGNFVIPQNREGKPFIYIAADGITPISASEWKLWKKYYKEQTKNFYQQQQQMSAINNSAISYPLNSMFHPLNLEQQHLYFAADMEMLQRTRRVRPEDVDLPDGTGIVSDAIHLQGLENEVQDPKQLKRKKFIEAQLKSIKMTIPSVIKKDDLKKSKKKESHKEKDIKKVEKKNQSKKGNAVLKMNKNENSPRKRHHVLSESISPKRQSSQNKKPRKDRSPSYSSTSSTSTYGSYSSHSYNSNETEKRQEQVKEKEIRNRIISRGTHDIPANINMATNVTQQLNKNEEKEYGPKPPVLTEKIEQNSSDMELSDGEQNLIERQQKENVGKSESAKKFQDSLEQQVQRMENHNHYIDGDKKYLEKGNGMSGTGLNNFINVKEVLKSGNLQMIKICKEQEQQRYDNVKLQIAELEVERSVHKRNWTLLKDAEKRLEGKRRTDVLSGDES